MNMQQIRVIARNNGVKASRLSKIKLEQAIQQVEGNFDCFATAVAGICDQLDCRWRSDCFTAAKKTQQCAPLVPEPGGVEDDVAICGRATGSRPRLSE